MYFDHILAHFLLFPLIIVAGGVFSDPWTENTINYPKSWILYRQKIRLTPAFSSGNRKKLPFCPLYINYDIYCALFVHSGDIPAIFFSRSSLEPQKSGLIALDYGKKLDRGKYPLYTQYMSKHIVKTDRTYRRFRVTIPRKVVSEKGWDNVSHVIVEDHWGDRIIIRRLMNDESPKKENSTSKT